MPNPEPDATLTISSGSQNSGSSSLPNDLQRTDKNLLIVAPDTLDGTVTVEVDKDAQGNTFQTLQSPPGTDVEVPAGKAIMITELPLPDFRLHSSTSEGSDRDFDVWLL